VDFGEITMEQLAATLDCSNTATSRMAGGEYRQKGGLAVRSLTSSPRTGDAVTAAP